MNRRPRVDGRSPNRRAGALTRAAWVVAGSLLTLTLGASPARADEPSVADAAVESLGAEVVALIAGGECARVAAHVNADGVVGRVFVGLEGIPAALVGQLSKNVPMGIAQICQGVVQQGAQVDLMQVRTRDGMPSFLMRMLSQGVDYYEFVTDDGAAGRHRVIDVFIASGGSWYSERVRALILPALKDVDRSVLSRLFGGQSDATRALEGMSEVAALAQQAQFGPAMELLEGLPESFRRTRLAVSTRIQLASQLDPATYKRVLAEESQRNGKAPELALLFLDHFFLEGDWPRAQGIVQQMERAYGPDAYLRFLAASIHLSAGQLDEAIAQSSMAIGMEPTLETAHWGHIEAQMAQEDWAGVLASLQRVDGIFDMEWQDFTEVPEYAGFVASPAYAQWLEYLKSRSPLGQPAAPEPGTASDAGAAAGAGAGG